jgi:hypothetical protein
VLPEGSVVRAYGLSGLIGVDGYETPDWGLYFDEQWEARALQWPHGHVHRSDFGLPVDELDAFDAFDEARGRAWRGEAAATRAGSREQFQLLRVSAGCCSTSSPSIMM